MTETIASLLDNDDLRWELPEGEGARQAIGALRGYAYQLHQSLWAWINLPDGGVLYLEAAEDYTTLARDPAALETVLAATQVKHTRESGSVTLNSPDVIDAVRRLWSLQDANPDRQVRLTFLTTSPAGLERRDPLPSGRPALVAWRQAARGSDVAEIRQALKARLTDPDPDSAIVKFLETADDETLRRRLLKPLSWACGQPPIEALEADNRTAIIELGHGLGGTPDLSARAAVILLGKVLGVIVGGKDRRLTRADLLETLASAVTISVPAQAAMAAMSKAIAGPALQPTLDLEATGAWREPVGAGPLAARNGIVPSLVSTLGDSGCLWLHGATGLGKTTLALLVARARGGAWRLLDLREAPPSGAAERLNAARNAVASRPGLQGVVVDDLTVEQERELEAPLGQLQAALERRDAVLVVTSRNPPGRRLMRAAGATTASVEAAPSFDEDDAAALVAAYGGDPATWAKFAWIAGGVGHPQLVDVVIAGLAARKWPTDEMQRWFNAGLKNEDVEAEREAARRRLLAELAPEVLQYLYRATHIVGAFDRELALEVGRADPALADHAASLDRLSGHWIERLSPTRQRASPLVAGLDRQMLSDADRARLDRVIALSILKRRTAQPDLIDTAFAHALMAEAEDLLTAIVQLVLDIDVDGRRPIASAMVMFRMARIVASGFLSDRPYVVLMLRLAQHRLIAAVADDEAFRASADGLVALLDGLPEPAISEGLVLTMLLLDEYAFGRLPNWFELLHRLDITTKDDPDLSGLAARVAKSTDYHPSDFTFLSHAIHLPGLEALSRLFDDLDRLDGSARKRWLDVLYANPSWLNLLVDNAWLKQSQTGPLDGRPEAALFRRLGDLALAWKEPRLAGRCFQAEAVMLDEYANDAAAALAALDRADIALGDNVDLKRARAKVAWRSKDHASALDQMSKILDRLNDVDPLDAAFVIRQAGVSAGELGRWAEGATLFERARQSALKATAGRLTPFNIGLGFDAAASRFAAGDRIEAVRQVRLRLEELGEIPADGDRKDRGCHLLARYVLQWMQSSLKTDPAPNDESPVYVPGCVSNPDLPAALDGRPFVAMATAWLMLARTALHLGLTSDEVLSWSGVGEIRSHAALDAILRVELLRNVIKHGSIEDFGRFVIDEVNALAKFSAGGLTPEYMSMIAPARGVIPRLSSVERTGELARGELRDAGLAMACRLVLPEDSVVDLTPLHQAMTAAAGFDPMPEWAGAAANEGDLRSVVAETLRILAVSRPTAIDDLYLAHLRLAEWAAASQYQTVVTPFLADRIQRDWDQILTHRSDVVIDPAHTVPLIRDALDAKRSGGPYIAGVLLAAEPAVKTDLSEPYRMMLRTRTGG